MPEAGGFDMTERPRRSFVPVSELPDYLASHPAELGSPDVHRGVLVFVDLDASCSRAELQAARAAALTDHRVLVGTCERAPSPVFAGLLEALTFTIAGNRWTCGKAGLAVDSLEEACEAIASTVDRAPYAALTLEQLLRLTATARVEHGLQAESLAYSMLLAGREFAQWRRSTSRTHRDVCTDRPVIVDRRDGCLDISLNRARLHNCFGQDMRDSLLEALDVALADGRTTIHLSGRGPSFCSGGCLDEFGVATDPVLAHLVRFRHSVAMRLHILRERGEATLHGACLGAGIEMPAFLARVSAKRDAIFQLPELGMGLIPGAGGTVSVTARIGRWRTAYLCLSARRIDAQTAFDWRLVDDLL